MDCLRHWRYWWTLHSYKGSETAPLIQYSIHRCVASHSFRESEWRYRYTYCTLLEDWTLLQAPIVLVIPRNWVTTIHSIYSHIEQEMPSASELLADGDRACTTWEVRRLDSLSCRVSVSSNHLTPMLSFIRPHSACALATRDAWIELGT